MTSRKSAGASSVFEHGFWSGVAAGSTEDARLFQQQRVSLFLRFIAIVLLIFYFIDVIAGLNERGVSSLTEPGSLVHVLLMFSFFGGWLFVRQGDRSAALLSRVEASATLAMLVGLAAIARSIPPQVVTEGPILATALTLVARAAIIPSSGTRTLVLGLFATAIVGIGYALRTTDRESLVGFAAIWTLAFTAASSLVSRVIYGLSRNVREARRLGQYVLDRKLGEGGMGTVYSARHAMLRRPTAVKLLVPAKAGADNLARFEHEVRQTARLSHPNTVTIYDYGRTPDGVFYYAMELLDGADLGEIVELCGPMEVGRIVHVIASVAGALAEAHAAGLIHRDIKPANIMLCQQGGMPDIAKVVDFGLVKELGEAGMTEAGALTGTPLYMAPEAITAPDSVDGRSDLYALGAVVYYLLTGRHVFEGKTVMEVCAQHLTKEPQPPSAVAEQPIPEALERLVLDCLHKDPAQRPASAAVFAERLLAVEGFAPWTAHEAAAWWTTHGPSLHARREGPADELGQTLAVDLDARLSA